MKKNESKKPIKEYKNMLSPKSKREKAVKFSQNIFKDFEINKLPLSHKKSQDELLLNKQKIISKKYHRRTKSNSEYYIQNLVNTENNFRNNPSMYQLSFVTKKKEKEKEVENNNSNKSTLSGNKNKNNNENQNNDFHNALSFSCSLKDLRKNLNNSCSSNKNLNVAKNGHNGNIRYYINELNLKNNKSGVFFDNTTNIEETRNTTSININNSNLLYNKHIIEKEKQKEKPKKYIKINRKHHRKIYSSMDNHLKICNTNANIFEEIKEKNSPKNNLHRFIYNNNNIKTKIYKTKFNNYLNFEKRPFRNSEKYYSKYKNDKNFSIIDPIFESYYGEQINNYKTQKKFYNNIKSSKISPKKTKLFNKKPFNATNKNKTKKKIDFIIPKIKKRTHRSQENYSINKIYEIEPIEEFDSVEEIHFMFVQLNQNKKQFFEKNDGNKK